MQRKRILVVAMLDSSHVAKWLKSTAYQNYEIVLFPSSPHRRLHPDVSRLLEDPRSQVSLDLMSKYFALPLWLIDQVKGMNIRRTMLSRLYKRIRPDVVHAIEFQHSAYLAEPIVRHQTTCFYVTNFGSDIYWFIQQRGHRDRIIKVLNRADYYSAECSRDVVLAKSLGYRGFVLPVRPNAGGIPQEMFGSGVYCPPSLRRVIAVKGYTNFVGRAQITLKALIAKRRDLNSFRVIVYSSTLRARAMVRWIRFRYRMNIQAIPKFSLSQQQVIQLMQESALYIGVSESDGLSTSMLEALCCGCFVIQSGTSCCIEVAEHGNGAYILNENSVPAVVTALEFFLQGLGKPWDDAAESNSNRLRSYLNHQELSEHARECYRLCLGNG